MSKNIDKKQTRGLGRGLGSILSETKKSYENSMDENNQVVLELDIDLIKPNSDQPRRHFDEESLKELSNSIKNQGLLQPVLVYENKDGDYVLIAGERRLRASKMAGISNIKAIIMDIEEKKLNELALIENIQRENLNPIELAQAYLLLMQNNSSTQEELARQLGISRAQIANTIRLLSLPKNVQDLIIDGKITQGHSKVLVGLDDNEIRVAVDSILGQKLSVKDTEEMIRKLKNQKQNPSGTRKLAAILDRNLLQKLLVQLRQMELASSFNDGKLTIKISDNETLEKLLNRLEN